MTLLISLYFCDYFTGHQLGLDKTDAYILDPRAKIYRLIQISNCLKFFPFYHVSLGAADKGRSPSVLAQSW